MASVAPEDAAGQPLVQATLVGEQGSLEITLKKPAADAKVGVSLVGSPPLVHQVRAGGLGAAAGLRLHDRVVSVNGLPVSGQEDAAAALAAAPAGPLVVVVERPAAPPPDAHVAPIAQAPMDRDGTITCDVAPGDAMFKYVAPKGGVFVHEVANPVLRAAGVDRGDAFASVNGLPTRTEAPSCGGGSEDARLQSVGALLRAQDDGRSPRRLVFRRPLAADVPGERLVLLGDPEGDTCIGVRGGLAASLEDKPWFATVPPALEAAGVPADLWRTLMADLARVQKKAAACDGCRCVEAGLQGLAAVSAVITQGGGWPAAAGMVPYLACLCCPWGRLDPFQRAFGEWRDAANRDLARYGVAVRGATFGGIDDGTPVSRQARGVESQCGTEGCQPRWTSALVFSLSPYAAERLAVALQGPAVSADVYGYPETYRPRDCGARECCVHVDRTL